MSKIPIVNLSIANTGYLKIGNAELNETELTRLLGLTGSSGSGGNGADGPTGPAGSVGIAGPTGADGAIGATGSIGPPGINGTDGSDGSDGSDGAMGPTGPAGSDSTVPGPIGLRGPTGAVGVGLRGPTGPYGGPMGPTGSKGDKGDQADIFDIVVYYDTVSDLISDQNFWTVGKHALVTVNDTNTASSIYINIGSGGADGIGHMNQWKFLLDITTFVINGQDGVTGPSGAAGVDGNVGADGAIGPTGPVGTESTVAGPPGTPGQIGPTGERGVDGLNGDTGPQGNRGDTGPPSELFIYKAYFSVSDPALLPDPNEDNLVIGDYVLYYGNENFQGAIYRYTGNGGVGFNSAYQFVSYVGQGTPGSQGATGPNGSHGPTGFVDPNSDISFNGNFTINNKTLYLNNSKLGINVSNPTSSLEIDGNTSLKTLVVSNDASMNGKLHVSNDFDVGTNKFTVASASGNTLIAGDTTLSKTLSVIGDVSFNNNLFVDGDVSMNGDVHIIGNLKADKFNQDFIINTETTNYTLIVAEDLSLNNRLFIEGDASFNEDIYVKGNVNFDGTINNITTTEFGYLDGVTSNIQTQMNSKQPTIGNSTRLDAGLIHDGSVSNTIFGYLNGVTSDIQTQINGIQNNNITFGIADTNAVKIDGSSAADDKYARFTSSGIEGRTTAELKSDIGLNNVTNESKSTMFSSPTFTGSISAPDNSIPAAAISGDIGGGASTITYMTTSIYNSSSTDHQDKLFAAYANIDGSGYKQYYMSKLQKIDNNDYEWYYTEINPMGSKSITIDDTWGPDAPGISYSGSPFTITDGDSVNITSSNSGGAATWSISPALTNGLSLDANNGNITGTASGTLTETDYTITATNSSGTNTATIKITIEVALVAPNISYSGSPFTFTDGDSVNITSNNSGGAVTSWAINPSVNNGLTFNTSTGNITGTASGTLTETDYTITATNSTDTSNVTITITIEAAAVSYPGISSVTYIPSDYSTNIANYNYGDNYVGLTTEGTIYFNIKLENPTNSQDTWYVIPMNLESDANNSTLTTLSYTNTNTTLHYLPSAYATNNNTTTPYNAGALFLANAANSTLYMYGKIPNTNWNPSYYSGGVDYNVQYGGNNKFVYRFVQNGTGGLSNLPGTMNTNYTYTANTGCIPPLPVNYNDASVKNALNDGQLFIGRYGDGLYLIIFINNAYKQIGLNIVTGISYDGNAATYNSDTHWVYPPS